MTDTLIIAGKNDEQTHCDRCGKLELRGTVILYNVEEGVEAGRYGTTCAGKVLTEANGRKITITGTEAARRENNRRDRVANYLRKAKAAMRNDDPALAQWIVWDMRRDATAIAHLDDELAIIAEVDATGRYVPSGENKHINRIRREFYLANGYSMFEATVQVRRLMATAA